MIPCLKPDMVDGVLDHMPRTSGKTIVTSSIGMTPTTLSAGVIENLMVRMRPNQKCVSMSVDPSMIGHRVVSPINPGPIIGEGAAIFTDMTETILSALDWQMALSSEAQRPEGSLTGNILTTGQLIDSNKVGESWGRTQVTPDTKDIYLTCFCQLQRITG